MAVLGEAKFEPQAYYIVNVGVSFVLFFFFIAFIFCKFIVPYLGRDAAGENSGLPGSCSLTKHLYYYSDLFNKINNNKHAQSLSCNACAPSKQ